MKTFAPAFQAHLDEGTTTLAWCWRITRADPDTAEGLTRAVTMIPASGEFTYATQAIRKTDGGATVPENLNALADSTDMVEALDRLQAMAPAVESVSLVVAWFGNDLRAGSCKVRPGVAALAIATSLLSGCATDGSDGRTVGTCPPVVEYSREFQARAAEELNSLPDGSAIAEMQSDYAVLRDQARACGSLPIPN